MSLQLATERRSVVAAPAEESPLGMVAAAAAIRGAAVAVSGALLAAAISLVLWALTPASGADATVAVRAGVAGFAAANLIPITIGGVALTIPPLLFTLLIAALLVVTVRRGRFLPLGRSQETLAVLVTAGCYGLAVAVITRAFAPEGVVPAAWVWTATALAFVAVAGASLCGRSAWHDWWRAGAPGWLRAACRAAGIGVCALLAGGGLALTAAMVTRFGSMVGVGALAAPSWTDGLGMALLGAAYVPNAVVAAVGYISGVGFEVGAGTYSPFGSSTVDLPALPLLAVAPDSTGRSLMGIALLAVPLLAGYLMARRIARHLGSRSERVLASASGATLTGVLLGCLSWVARGGVGTGLWSAMGPKPLLVGAVVAAELAAVAVATALLVGARTVPWRPDGKADTGADGDDAADDPADAAAAHADGSADGSADGADTDDFDATSTASDAPTGTSDPAGAESAASGPVGGDALNGADAMQTAPAGTDDRIGTGAAEEQIADPDASAEIAATTDAGPVDPDSSRQVPVESGAVDGTQRTSEPPDLEPGDSGPVDSSADGPHSAQERTVPADPEGHTATRAEHPGCTANDAEPSCEADPDSAARSTVAGPGVVLPEQRGQVAVHSATDR